MRFLRHVLLINKFFLNYLCLFVHLLHIFLFKALNHSSLCFCVFSQKSVVKSATNNLKLIYRTCLNCKRPVTSDFALLVEACLGISPELLINMQSRYNLTKAKMNPSLIARISNIRKVVAAL